MQRNLGQAGRGRACWRHHLRLWAPGPPSSEHLHLPGRIDREGEIPPEERQDLLQLEHPIQLGRLSEGHEMEGGGGEEGCRVRVKYGTKGKIVYRLQEASHSLHQFPVNLIGWSSSDVHPSLSPARFMTSVRLSSFTVGRRAGEERSKDRRSNVITKVTKLCFLDEYINMPSSCVSKSQWS